eukprot:3565064-Pyramimonas_sp.AAC.1
MVYNKDMVYNNREGRLRPPNAVECVGLCWLAYRRVASIGPTWMMVSFVSDEMWLPAESPSTSRLRPSPRAYSMSKYRWQGIPSRMTS